MKKILTLLCMITCIFGLTACGTQETYSEATLSHIDGAESMAETMTNYLVVFFDNETLEGYEDYYSASALEYMFESEYSIYVDGLGLLKAMDSFNSSYDEFGDLVSIGDTTTTVSDDEIYVSVEVVGTENTGVVNYTFSNDYFIRMEGATLNVDKTFGEKMEGAALNTLLGMGTVFILLILISFLISGLSFVPKLLNKSAKKEKTVSSNEESINQTIAQIIEKEELSDDLELVAVITAAIAAYSGTSAQSTDGFVVRSIKKAGRAR